MKVDKGRAALPNNDPKVTLFGPKTGLRVSWVSRGIGQGSSQFRSLGLLLSSADLHGKVVLIDFWATWCQPCKKEMPGYQSLADRYGSRGLVVIGFKFDTMPDMEDPIEFARGMGVHYPLALATDDLKQKFGGVEGLPTTILYDRQGILRAKIIGFEYTDNIESALKPLLVSSSSSHN